MSTIQLPRISFFFEKTPRRIVRHGNSAAVTVPPAFEQSSVTLGERRMRAMVLRNYLVYTPLPFTMQKKRQLLDLAMTSLEALAMLDDSEEIKKAWLMLKRLEDEYDVKEEGMWPARSR